MRRTRTRLLPAPTIARPGRARPCRMRPARPATLEMRRSFRLLSARGLMPSRPTRQVNWDDYLSHPHGTLVCPAVGLALTPLAAFPLPACSPPRAAASWASAYALVSGGRGGDAESASFPSTYSLGSPDRVFPRLARHRPRCASPAIPTSLTTPLAPLQCDADSKVHADRYCYRMLSTRADEPARLPLWASTGPALTLLAGSRVHPAAVDIGPRVCAPCEDPGVGAYVEVERSSQPVSLTAASLPSSPCIPALSRPSRPFLPPHPPHETPRARRGWTEDPTEDLYAYAAPRTLPADANSYASTTLTSPGLPSSTAPSCPACTSPAATRPHASPAHMPYLSVYIPLHKRARLTIFTVRFLRAAARTLLVELKLIRTLAPIRDTRCPFYDIRYAQYLRATRCSRFLTPQSVSDHHRTLCSASLASTTRVYPTDYHIVDSYHAQHLFLVTLSVAQPLNVSTYLFPSTHTPLLPSRILPRTDIGLG
ncbi:hypothetical protein DFH06DRAFT_1466702 [Mycena polygramma]|nr:hypothetical protein DFH06DRAFT_1466702 [Mycena polygramma]